MKPVLIQIRPMVAATGQRIDVRLGDGLSAEEYGTAGLVWQPGITNRPSLSIELMSPDMDGKTQVGKASFEIDVRALRGIASPETLYWRGAPVTIRSTGVLEGPTAIPDFVGYVTGGVPDRTTGRLRVQAEVSAAFLDRDVLIKEFSGGGGADGDPTKRGVLRPLGMGVCFNIQPVWFDLTRYIGQIDGYGNTLSINWLGEALSSFGAPVADYPNYAALEAAIDNHQIVKGRWGTCIAEGLVGLGAPPVGIITVHAIFAYNRIGAMMKRLYLNHAQVPAAVVNSNAFDMLDALVPRPVHYWTGEQANVKERCEALAASCNATPLVTFQGKVTVSRAVAAAPIGELNRSGGVRPRVLSWANADVDPPYAQLKARTARPALVMGYDQVNFGDDITDQGLYNDATAYKNGNTVWLSNKSKWLYINPVPGAGHRPPAPPQTSDDYWQQLLPPTTSDNITYADGTTLEQMKPSQPGADKTSDHTSKDTAAVAGRPAQSVVQDIDINATGILAAALRQDDYERAVEARTYVEGQAVNTTFLQFRNSQTNQNSAFNTLFQLIGAKTSDGTGFVMNLSTVQIGGGKTLAQKFDDIGASNGSLTVNVQQLMEAVINPDGSGYGKFVLRTTANGAIAGISGLAGGGIGTLSFVANNFYFADPNGGNPINILSYETSTKRWIMSGDLYVQKLVANTVQTNNLVGSAAQQTEFVILGSDVSIPRNQTATVASITFTKDEASSLLRVQFFGNFWSQDDIQFQASLVVDGSIAYPFGTVNMVLDSLQSQGRVPITPFLYLRDISAGTHTLDFTVLNNEVDNIPLVVKSGSCLEVLEYKKAMV